jgi:hypothetical protein
LAEHRSAKDDALRTVREDAGKSRWALHYLCLFGAEVGLALLLSDTRETLPVI